MWHCWVQFRSCLRGAWNRCDEILCHVFDRVSMRMFSRNGKVSEIVDLQGFTVNHGRPEIGSCTWTSREVWTGSVAIRIYVGDFTRISFLAFCLVRWWSYWSKCLRRVKIPEITKDTSPKIFQNPQREKRINQQPTKHIQAKDKNTHLWFQHTQNRTWYLDGRPDNT